MPSPNGSRVISDSPGKSINLSDTAGESSSSEELQKICRMFDSSFWRLVGIAVLCNTFHNDVPIFKTVVIMTHNNAKVIISHILPDQLKSKLRLLSEEYRVLPITIRSSKQLSPALKISCSTSLGLLAHCSLLLSDQIPKTTESSSSNQLLLLHSWFKLKKKQKAEKRPIVFTNT